MLSILNKCKLNNYCKINQRLDILCFSRSKNFTDSGLINFGKSLKSLSALNSISINFAQ